MESCYALEIPKGNYIEDLKGRRIENVVGEGGFPFREGKSILLICEEMDLVLRATVLKISSLTEADFHIPNMIRMGVNKEDFDGNKKYTLVKLRDVMLRGSDFLFLCSLRKFPLISYAKLRFSNYGGKGLFVERRDMQTEKAFIENSYVRFANEENKLCGLFKVYKTNLIKWKDVTEAEARRLGFANLEEFNKTIAGSYRPEIELSFVEVYLPGSVSNDFFMFNKNTRLF